MYNSNKLSNSRPKKTRQGLGKFSKTGNKGGGSEAQPHLKLTEKNIEDKGGNYFEQPLQSRI